MLRLKAADSVGAAETTKEAAKAATTNLACGARQRHACQLPSAAGERTRGRLAWADIVQASGFDGEFTCKLPPLGRVGHVGREELDVQERAHVAAVVDVPMPV